MAVSLVEFWLDFCCFCTVYQSGKGVLIPLLFLNSFILYCCHQPLCWIRNLEWIIFLFNIKWDMSWPILSCGIMNQCELNKAVFYSWKFSKCVPFQVHGNRFILFYLQSTLAWRLQYTLSLLPTVGQLLWRNSGQDLAVKTKSTQAIKLYCVFCRAVRS